MNNVVSITFKADKALDERAARLENGRRICEQRRVIMDLERQIDYHENQEVLYMELAEEAEDFTSRRIAADFASKETKKVNELTAQLKAYLAATGL